MRIAIRLFFIWAACWPSTNVGAVVIDDFLAGPNPNYSVRGVSWSNSRLPPEHVIGGNRANRLWDGPTSFQITLDVGLRIEQIGSLSGFPDHPTLQYTNSYGTASKPLNANLAAGGQDRFQLRYTAGTESWSNGKIAMWVNSTWTEPPDLGIGPSLNVVAGGGVVEIPFSLFGPNFVDIDKIVVGGLRLDVGNHFILRSITTAGPPTPGDFDRDGDADGDDLAELQRTFGRQTGTTDGFLSTDENRNGVVDGDDFLAWQRASQATPAATSVPEPASVLAALMCVLAVPVFRRSKVARE